MRVIVAFLLLCAPLTAVAQESAVPCFTEESRARAAEIRFITPERTVARPVGRQRVLLNCEVRDDRGIACVIVEEPASPYPFGERALRIADALEACSAEPAQFQLPITFTDED